MVASCLIISKTNPKSGKPFLGRYYTRHTYADYLERGGERVPFWLGKKLKSALQLPDTTCHAHLSRTLQGKHPTEDRYLVPPRKYKKITRGKIEKQPRPAACVDVTFSLGKDVSVLWVYSSGKRRREIEAAAKDALIETFNYVEENLPLARCGKHGRKRERASLLATAAFHRLSRAEQFNPHLHFHLVFQALCRTKSGRWQGIDTRLLRNWVRTLGPIFRAAFSKHLKARTGLELERARDPEGNDLSWFKVKGIPEDLCDHWSSRSKDIQKDIDGALEEEKITDATPQAKDAARIATRKSRKAIPPEKELIDKLRRDARRFGFSQEKAERLYGKATEVDIEKEFPKAFSRALQRLTETQAHFTYRELVRQAAEEIQTVGISPKDLASRIKYELEHSNEIKHLTDQKGYERFTTKRMWDLEEATEVTADNLNKRPGFVLPLETVDHLIFKMAKHLTIEQEQAVRHIFTTPGSCKVVTGVAGAGKSRMLDAVREILEKAGKDVSGVALSGAATEGLRASANLKSRTIASLLHHAEKPAVKKMAARVSHDAKQFVRALKKKTTYCHRAAKLTSNSVVIVDEAGMVDTATMFRILRRCERAGAEVILVGDDHQLQPIGAGGVLRYLKKVLPHFHMEDNLRQVAPRDKLAVKQLRDAEVKPVLAEYLRRGMVTVKPTRLGAIRALVNTWVAEGGVHRPSSHVVFTMTRAEAHQVNRLIQEERRLRGAVKGYQSVTCGREEFFAHDRVMVHVPYRKLGIENGFRGTVLAVNAERREMVVRFDQTLRPYGKLPPANNIITLPLKELPDNAVTLSYACTTHKLQGASCDHAYLLVGGRMTDREMIYVQATRGRQSTRFFVDELHAGKGLDDLAASVSRSRQKDMAHDYTLKQKQEPNSLKLELGHE